MMTGSGQYGNGQGASHGGSRNWDKVRGHKLDSDVEASSLHLRPSFDAIPLVSTGNTSSRSGGAEPDGMGGIHKTMEVSVSSETLKEESLERR
jgi:hypothetical protein